VFDLKKQASRLGHQEGSFYSLIEIKANLEVKHLSLMQQAISEYMINQLHG
jgi:hypothetical protein